MLSNHQRRSHRMRRRPVSSQAAGIYHMCQCYLLLGEQIDALWWRICSDYREILKLGINTSGPGVLITNVFVCIYHFLWDPTQCQEVRICILFTIKHLKRLQLLTKRQHPQHLHLTEAFFFVSPLHCCIFDDDAKWQQTWRKISHHCITGH